MRILITAIGSASCYDIATSLYENHDLYGCDINDGKYLFATKRFKKTYICPYSYNKNDYTKQIKQIVDNESIEMIIPLTDPECDVLSKNKHIFENTIVACLDNEINKICRDKLSICNEIKNICDTIPSYSISKQDNIKYPVIIKPRNGRSSQDTHIVDNQNELNFYFSIRNDYIIQKFIKGDIYTVDSVRDKFGNCVSLVRKEIIRSVNGLGMTVETLQVKNLENKVKAIMEKLNIIGCVNLEFIKDEGKFFFMDFNPRMSGGVGFSIMSGYDFAKNHILAHIGKKIDSLENVNYQLIIQGYKKEYR